MLGVPPRLSAHEASVLALRARYLRRNPTPSEAALWRLLRGGRLGVRFVRQAVIGRFIVDFLSREARLVVEVDGGYHATTARADERRDCVLSGLGYRVLRLPPELVQREPGLALARVRAVLG